MEISIEVMKKKVEYFYKNGVAVHIKKKNGYFHNGIILEYVLDFIILEDERTGAMPIYFEEILEIEKKGVKDGGN